MNNLNPLNTAVLFITYKRLDTTIQVFESIRKAKPPRLYISSNHGKDENENKKVQAVRDFFEKNIDWECEVNKLYRDEHLSAKLSISGAIDWFFENEEMGIILEDDCLPSQSFFWFCEELLDRYKHDRRVGQISGDNFQNGIKRGEGDYFFSVYIHTWGWASWADRWENYDVELTSIENNNFIDDIITEKNTNKYWKNVFEQMKQQKIDTWDYQWTFTLWSHKQLTILPNVNLISNIGFGADATHTSKDNEFSKLIVHELVIEKHPLCVEINQEADTYTSDIWFRKKPIILRIINKISRTVIKKNILKRKIKCGY